MEVQCPHCDTRFSLPDIAAKPGAKLRCSTCNAVFSLAKDGSAKPVKEKKSGGGSNIAGILKKVVVIVLFLAIIGGGGGMAAWWFLLKPKDANNLDDVTSVVTSTDSVTEQPSQTLLTPEERVNKLSMARVHQYFVDNEAVGKVFVVDGFVVNNFNQPRSMITLEASIYNKAGALIASKSQLAGTQLTLFQLQVVDSKGMDAFLTNKVEILTNNTDVAPGSEVPFMILFYPDSKAASQRFADNIHEFGLRIIDAKESSEDS